MGIPHLSYPMKLPRFLVLAALSASTLASLPAAEPTRELVLDFTYMQRETDGTYKRSYEYGFGDWDEKGKVGQVAHQGLLVNHAGSKGGVGENRRLDFSKSTKVGIAFMIGNRNQAAAFGLSLTDRDGTGQVWQIPLAGQPRGQALYAEFDLKKPTRTDNAGKVAGLDLKKIESWQITGDFGDAPVELLVMKVFAVSP